MEQKQPEKRKHGKRYVLVGSVLGILLLLPCVGCTTPTPLPTATPNAEATEVAMAQALQATMTALAPTPTPTQTHSPTATITQTPSSTATPTSTMTSTNTATPRPTFTATPTSLTGKWRIAFDISPFDDTRSVFLSLKAESPIEGWLKTYTPVLMLRCEERRVEAYVVTGMDADVEYGMVDSATIRVRFGKEKAQTLVAGKSTSGESLFFRAPLGIIASMLNHDEMVYEFTPFNASPVVTSFDLRGLSEVIPSLQEACGLTTGSATMRYPTPTATPIPYTYPAGTVLESEGFSSIRVVGVHIEDPHDYYGNTLRGRASYHEGEFVYVILEVVPRKKVWQKPVRNSEIWLSSSVGRQEVQSITPDQLTCTILGMPQVFAYPIGQAQKVGVIFVLPKTWKGPLYLEFRGARIPEPSSFEGLIGKRLELGLTAG